MSGYYLFMIIPVMIGIFGATYTVITFIKSSGDRKVANYQTSAETMLSTIFDFNLVSHGTCQKLYKSIGICSNCWKFCLAVPVILFATWSFYTAFYISTNQDCKLFLLEVNNNNHSISNIETEIGKEAVKVGSSLPKTVPMFFSQKCVFFITIVDSLCILISLLLLFLIWILHLIIGSHHNAALNGGTKPLTSK